MDSISDNIHLNLASQSQALWDLMMYVKVGSVCVEIWYSDLMWICHASLVQYFIHARLIMRHQYHQIYLCFNQLLAKDKLNGLTSLPRV